VHKAAAATGSVEITWPIAAIAMTQGILVTSRGLIEVWAVRPRHFNATGGFSYTVGRLKEGGSIMTVEHRLEQLEKRNKRLTVGLTMTVVAMCAVATMAATGEKYSGFDTVVARHIAVVNDEGEIVVSLGANDDGNGVVYTMSANGNDLVMLTSTDNGNGAVTTYQSNGKDLVNLTSTDNGGTVKTYQPNGKELVALTSTDNGGMVYVMNKTNETIADMKADEYGNGLVGAYNSKGDGGTLKPGL